MDKRINIETERAAFEAWAEQSLGKNLLRMASGDYVLSRASFMWNAWQAARAAPAATGAMEDLPQLLPKRVYHWNDLFLYEREDVLNFAREAIAYYQRKQAEQAESAVDLVRIAALRAAPASQHDAGFAEIKPWKERLFEEQPSLKGLYRNDESGALDEMGIYHAHDEIDDLRAELARRCRVQGGNTKSQGEPNDGR